MSYGKLLLCLEYLIIIITLQFTTQAVGHKCYVCGGKDAQLPFIENQSIVNDYMNTSCREFDNLSIADRKRYEFECPKNFNGCITKITTVTSVVRTCSDVAIDDCRSIAAPEDQITEYICICKNELCNQESAQKIISELRDTIDIDNDDNEEEDGDDESEESGDNFISSTQKATNWQTTFSSTNVNDAAKNSNESTIVPSINKSVSFNLSSLLAIICLSTSFLKSFL